MNVRKCFLGELFLYQKGRCNFCNFKFKIEELVVDHIKAKCLGGNDNLENLQLLCFRCHDKEKTPQDMKKLTIQKILVT